MSQILSYPEGLEKLLQKQTIHIYRIHKDVILPVEAKIIKLDFVSEIILVLHIYENTEVHRTVEDIYQLVYYNLFTGVSLNKYYKLEIEI